MDNTLGNIIACDLCDTQAPESEFKIDIYNRKVCPICQENIMLQTATLKVYNSDIRFTYKWNSLFGFTDDAGEPTKISGINGYEVRPYAMVAKLDDTLVPVIRGWMTGRYENVKHKHLSNDFYDAMNSGRIKPNFLMMISLSQNGQFTMAVEVIMQKTDVDEFKQILGLHGMTLEQLQAAFK